MIKLAQRARNNGEPERAERILRRHLQREQDDGRAWELLGLILFENGEIAASVSALETATLLAPLRTQGRICLAHGYGQLGHVELSRDLLVAMIPDPSLSAPHLLQVAGGLDAIGQHELAVQACRSALRREPESAQGHYDMGYYSARSGAPSHVVETLARQAVSLEPGNVRYRIGLASMLVQQERLSDGYACISRLSDDQIRRIACRCCLQRVVSLFEAAGDIRRARMCLTHLRHLELRDTAGDCD
ncbi:MAG: tetratricopeptide repeat protein [Maioricimonas sp. JB049]